MAPIQVQLVGQGYEWADALVTLAAVLVGAILTYATTSLFERRKDREERKAKAIELLLKTQELVNAVLSVDRQVRVEIRDAEADGVNGPAWTKIPSIAGIERYEIQLPITDLSVLVQGRNYVLIQQIAELRDGHNGVIRGLQMLAGMKDSVGQTVGPRMEGRVGHYFGNLEADFPQLGPTLANLEVLGDDLLEHLDRLVPKAREVAQMIGRTLRTELKDPQFPAITVEEPLGAAAPVEQG